MPAGKFYEAVARGRVFSVSTVVAGLAIPISTGTAPTVALWNPVHSGVVVNLVRYAIAYVSGTTVAGAVGFQFKGASDTLGATELYSAFAASEISNARIGSGAVSKIYASAAGTNTLGAAVVAWMPTGLGIDAEIATTANPPVNVTYDFDGLLQLMPGFTAFPCASAASGALFSQILYWEEVPLLDA